MREGLQKVPVESLQEVFIAPWRLFVFQYLVTGLRDERERHCLIATVLVRKACFSLSVISVPAAP
jgi:hypothetical protein